MTSVPCSARFTFAEERPEGGLFHYNLLGLREPDCTEERGHLFEQTHESGHGRLLCIRCGLRAPS